MQNDNVILPLDIYASCLKTINGIEFTPREVDIIACLLNGRSAKTMPSFLSISPKTVTTHINNIRRKAGCSSGEGIIDFIESSDKYSLIKHHYYSSLLNQLSFEKFLKASLREVSPPSLFCTLIDMQEKNDKPSLIHYLESHLKLMGIPVKYTNRAKKPPPSEEMKGSPDEYSLYIGATVPQTLILNENNTIFLITHKQLSKNCSQKCIDFSDPGNYYLSFIELLKILFPHHKFDQTSPDFMPYSRITSESSKKEYPPSSIVAKSVQAKLSLKTAKEWVSLFFKSRPLWLNLTGLIILGVGLTYIFSLVYMEDKTGKAFKNSPGSSRNFVRSDLFLPTETAFLNRKLLLSKLEKKLESNQGIQMAVLVGIGGSGKTTLARHYAQNQPASVVWEINAETKEKLMVSFEELAYALSKSQEEKKNLKEIQDIKNPAEKEKCLLIFLKERLKSHPNWLLIYDNLEAIADIKNFLPYDSDAWGNGKIILTTRNETLQNTSYIQAENMIPLGELSPEDAFKLFTKILYGSQPLTVIQKEQSLSLLKNIPLFPLDISMAAYYIKNSQLTPDQYLERISHNSQKFDVFQEALLKEVSDYTKTRSGIIISALEKLIHQSPDFQDLLLFISLLDFQHIPNHLLESYKDPALVDRFIHDLRRNALLTYETSEVKGRETMNEGISSFSLHRSTQAISLAFLLSLLSEEEKIKFMNSMLSSIQSFHGKYLKTKCVYILPLVPHLEALLKNLKSLKLPASLEEQYRENLLLLIGSSHYCCADNLHLAKEYFTQILNKNSHLEGKFYAEMLSDLALSCVDLGDLDEALEYCQKGLSLCKKIPNSTLLTAEILKTMGAAYSDKNDLPKAQSYFEAALKMIASINSKEKKELESEIYEHLASLYSKTYINKPEAHEAVKYAIKGLETWGASHLVYKSDLKKQGNIPDSLAKHKWRLGQVYNRLGQYQDAFEKGFREAQYLLDHHSDKFSYSLLRPQIALGMGEIYLRGGQLKEAETHLSDAVNNLGKLLGAYRAFPARVLRAETYIQQGKLNEAYEDCKAVFNINKKPDNNYLKLMFLTTYYHAAVIKYKMGDLTKAADYLSEFLGQIKPFCKSFLDEKTYAQLDSKGTFSPLHYNKENTSNVLRKQLSQAAEIFSAIYGSSHPFIQKYIAKN